MKKVELRLDEFYGLLLPALFFCSDNFPIFTLILTLLFIVVSMWRWTNGTWLHRLFFFIIPPLVAVICVVNGLINAEKSAFDEAMNIVDTEAWLLPLYYMMMYAITDEELLKTKPKYRSLVYKNYVWNGWGRDETMSYYLKYKDMMREDEKAAIEEKLIQFNREQDEKALDEFRSKTGLDEVPVIENPDKKLEYAAISAIKRGWTSVDRIRSEFGIDTKRSERILDQLQNLRICGNPREVYLTELGKDEVYYMCDIGRIGVRFKNYAMSDDEADAIANRVVKWCDENLDEDLEKGSEDRYLSMVEKFLESKNENMDVEKKWIVRDEVSHIFFTRKLNEAVQKSESLGDYGP